MARGVELISQMALIENSIPWPCDSDSVIVIYLLYPRNLKFRGYYGFGPDAVSAAAVSAAAAARQGLCFT